MSNYYDVSRSILEAIAALDGYKVYSQAFTYFLKKKDEGNLSRKFERFRKLRNKINYYGEEISIKEDEENIRKIKKMIEKLKDKYMEEVR